MDNTMLYLIGGILAIVILFFVVRFYLKNKKATKKVYKKSGVDLKALILALGGHHNILETSSTMSKVTVVLKETNGINIEDIKKLGATRIVQNQNKVSMIFGKVSETLEEELKQAIKDSEK